MENKYYDAIINGVTPRSFPKVPVDYGYRNSTKFWYTRSSRPIGQKIPTGKEADLATVMFAANRMDPAIKFEEEACAALVKVPRLFLKIVLQGCIDHTKKNNITLITSDTMKKIQDKRSKDKKS